MKTLSAVLALSAALALPSFAAPAQQNETLDRYVVALALNPDNAFYEYAVVQTAHRLGVEAPSLPGSSGRRSPWQTGVYEMTTGAWAVQESLQLDRLAGNGDVVSPATVPVASVEGVSAPSIPFEQLMKGRTSVVEPQ